MVKKIIIIFIILIIILGTILLIKDKEEKQVITNNNEVEEMANVKLIVNDNVLNVSLTNNKSAAAFLEKLKENDIVIEASDYGNFEKIGNLNFSLPQSNENITTSPGDVILYQGDKITVYYDENTWNFTRLGHIENITKEKLLAILGPSNVTLRFTVKDF